MTFLWTSAPVLIALASFAVFVLSDPANILDANTAFVSLTYFNLLRVPMNLLPILLVYIVKLNPFCCMMNDGPSLIESYSFRSSVRCR